ncbi:MAG: alpha/beta hydrolase [Rhodocyclales bacterium]|nr:alpha/beta hydrolase [Rhodocyclales bacterium]
MTPQLGEFIVRGPHGFSRVAYTEWGSPQAARAVICAHGLTRNGRDFDNLAQALAARGCRVLAPDLPGRGRSEWIRTPEHYDLPLYASVMGALIARIGASEVDWIGTSLGGFIGMQLAAEAGSPIRRLVLNDFGARVPAMALHRIGSYVGISPRFEHIEEVEDHLRRIHAPFGSLTGEQWRHLARHSAVATDDGSLRLHHDPAIARRFSWPLMLDISLWQVWDRVGCPVLILRGEHSDLLQRNTVEEMARRHAPAIRCRVSTIEIPGCGHAPALMSEAQIAPIAEFLLADGARCSGPRPSARLP